MTYDDRERIERLYDEIWASVHPDLRASVVAHLRKIIPPELAQQIRATAAEHGRHDWIHNLSEYGEHHGVGMAIRNSLRRAGFKDDQLPPFDAYYGEGTDVRNWDDYYVQATSEAILDA